MSSPCEECGLPLLWGGMSWVEHTEGWHAATRKVWLRAALRRLTEELVHRQEAQRAAEFYASVLVVWRVVLPTEMLYSTSVIPGETWDQLDQRQLLAWMGHGALDWLETTKGMRIHPSRLKYRVFDERDRFGAPGWRKASA